jgi:hypothetical protein
METKSLQSGNSRSLGLKTDCVEAFPLSRLTAILKRMVVRLLLVLMISGFSIGGLYAVASPIPDDTIVEADRCP